MQRLYYSTAYNTVQTTAPFTRKQSRQSQHRTPSTNGQCHAGMTNRITEPAICGGRSATAARGKVEARFRSHVVTSAALTVRNQRHLLLRFVLFFYVRATSLHRLSSARFSPTLGPRVWVPVQPIRGRNICIVKCSPSSIPHISSCLSVV